MQNVNERHSAYCKIYFRRAHHMKVVCIGDSLTRGYGVQKKECWVELLNERAEVEFINKGINGDTSGGMLSRFQNDVVLEKPRYAIVMGGFNDFIVGGNLSTVKPNMMAMIHQAYHHGITPIVGICIQPDLSMLKEEWIDFIPKETLIQTLMEYHNWLMDFCKVFRLSCIDLFVAFQNEIQGQTSRYLLDGLHPGPEGHRILAEIIEKKILLLTQY